MTEIPTWLEELIDEVTDAHTHGEGWCSQRWQLVRAVRDSLEDEDDAVDDLMGLLIEKLERMLEEERNRCANRGAAVDRGLDRADEIQQEQVMTADEAADIRRVLGEERVRGFTCPDVAIQVRCPSCGGCWYVPSQCVGDPMFDCPFCRESLKEAKHD